MRIEYIKIRLANWARYMIIQKGGGLGYPSSCAYLSERVQSGSRDSKIPIIETDAEEMNQAVNAMGVAQPSLKQAVFLDYIKGMSRSDIAREIGCVPSTVQKQMERADAWLDAWLRDKANRLANQRQIKKVIV